MLSVFLLFFFFFVQIDDPAVKSKPSAHITLYNVAITPIQRHSVYFNVIIEIFRIGPVTDLRSAVLARLIHVLFKKRFRKCDKASYM